MARFHSTPDGNIPYTAAEETARDTEEQAWTDGTAVRNATAEIHRLESTVTLRRIREMIMIRKYRDSLLTETDWMSLGDVTMSDAWKTYRQLLRDIPASNTTYADVTWPTKPS